MMVNDYMMGVCTYYWVCVLHGSHLKFSNCKQCHGQLKSQNTIFQAVSFQHMY